MIDYLIIEKYQPYYKKVIFNFSKGVNSIIGDTDSGKSSVMRALKAILKNDKSTLKFRNRLCKKGEAFKITIKKGNDIVERIRSEKDNIFVLNGKKFKAFGQGVPDDIKKVFNLEDINIKFQFKDNFLISDSPPEVARYFNKLVNLEAIDRAFQNANRKKLKNNQDKSNLEKSLKENNEKLRRYDDIDRIELKLRKIESLAESIEAKEKRLKSLLGKIEEAQCIVKEMSSLPDIKGMEKSLNNTKSKIENLGQEQKRLDAIKSTLDFALQIKGEMDKLPDDSVMSGAPKELETIKLGIDSIENKLTKGLSIEGKINSANIIEKELKTIPDIKGMNRGITKIKMGLEAFDELAVKKGKLVKLVSGVESILMEKDGIEGSLSVIVEELKKVPRCNKCGQPLIKGLDKCL